MSAGYHPYAAAEEEQAEAELVALLMTLVRLPTAALLAQLTPAEAEACVGPLLAALTVHRGAAVPLQLVPLVRVRARVRVRVRVRASVRVKVRVRVKG